MPTAPINLRFAQVYNFVLQPRDPLPIIRGWNRLEGRPRSADFERSLRAEARDPLWFLTRQWQFGEFQGEDAGSPIDARIAYQSGALDTFTAAGKTSPYNPAQTPMEPQVEAEPPVFDLTLQMQAAQVFGKLLQERGHPARLTDYVGKFALDYSSISGANTIEAQMLFAAGNEFIFDAAKVLAAVRDGTHATVIASFPGMSSNEANDLVEVGKAFMSWFENVYGTTSSTAADSPWQPSRLDYAFSTNATALNVQLTANAYDGSGVDWHSFDVSTPAAVSPNGTANPAPTPAPAPATALSFLPSSIRFAGMPTPRYWEMEDSKTDFGAMDANTNDLAKLLLAEFMLLYSNDWCVLPLELPVGSFTRVQGLLVTDVFGDQTFVRAADQGEDSDWQRWSMFRLNGDSSAQMGLLLAPALTAKVSADSLEEVHFLRDEMANLIWGVESRVMSKLGEPLNPEIGYTAPAAPPSLAGARYVLGTSVPPNWRPFLPAHLPGSDRSIRLQRARLPDQPAQALGQILNQPAPYFIAEEEIPRSGRVVDRAYQRSRWSDGSAFLWVGRSSLIDRGEGLSGLVFDQIDETTLRSSD